MGTATMTAMDHCQMEQTAQSREGKYLTFSLDREEYGIVIYKVKEIIGMMPITLVPQTPDFIKGVINLRGKVIPVLDLRRKFRARGIRVPRSDLHHRSGSRRGVRAGADGRGSRLCFGGFAYSKR